MISKLHLENILFLDIETVPETNIFLIWMKPNKPLGTQIAIPKKRR